MAPDENATSARSPGGSVTERAGGALVVEDAAPLLRIRINRPQVRNALSYELATELCGLLDEIDARADIRVVILTGAGERAFISGADVTEFGDRLSTAAGALEFDQRLEDVARRLESLRQPVIALIRGAAVGSGLLIALACDVRIAVQGAKFGVPVSRIGLVPSPPDLNRLVSFAGLAFAKHLLFTGAVVDAAEAQAHGLVDRVVSAEAAEAAAAEYAATLAARAPLSIGAMKTLLRDAASGSADIRDAEEIYRRVFTSRDFGEGVAAFLEKRAPRFEGR